MSVPSDQRKPISFVHEGKGNQTIEGEWVESGVEVEVTGAGATVSDGRVYITDGRAMNIGDSSIQVDDPSVKNHLYLIRGKDGYYLGYNTTGNAPTEQYAKIAEVTPDMGEVIQTNRGNPPTATGTSRIDSLVPGEVNNVVHVAEQADLPAESGGTHTLEDQTAYKFDGFVTSPYGLELGVSSPLIGSHGSVDGFIHTGGQTALTNNGNGYFARDMYMHAPGGTLYDLSADNTTEMLVESCAFSDAAGIANIADLGEINGFRVPTWKGCNFEDFNTGLRFDGNPDKIFVWGSPFRRVTSSGVTMLTLAATANVQIVDFADNYVKDVESDTEVWRVEDGGEPSEVFQYRGTTHDTSINKDNIISGPNADPQLEPFWVSDSYPLRESSVVGEISLDGETTTTIDSQGTWVQVAGPTTLGNETERMEQPSNGLLEYVGSKDSNLHINVSVSMYGANGSVYRIGIGKNGTLEDASTMEIQAGGQNANVSVSTSSVEDVSNGDTISLLVQNVDGTSDATFTAYTINSLGM
jgi:hypothetical protein